MMISWSIQLTVWSTNSGKKKCPFQSLFGRFLVILTIKTVADYFSFHKLIQRCVNIFLGGPKLTLAKCSYDPELS